MSLCGDGGDSGGGSENGGGGEVGLACDTGGGLVAERIGCNIREVVEVELLVEGGEREWGVTRNWSGPSINIVSGLRPSRLVGWLVSGCGVLAA